MNGPTRFVALALLLSAIACSSDTTPASTPSPPSTGGGTTSTPASPTPAPSTPAPAPSTPTPAPSTPTPAPSTPAPAPSPTGGGGATPAFAGEADSATDGAGSAFNRSSLSLNVSGTGTLLIVAWHAEFDGGLPDGWTVTANGTPGTLLVDTNGYTGGDGNRRFRIYYWLNPAPGPNTIVVANPYNGANELAVSAILLTGVAQPGPLGDVVRDVSTNGRTSESETVPTTTSDLVVHVIADATLVRGTLGSGEMSLSVANDGNQKLNAGDGDASLWIASKPGTSPTTTVSSSGWPTGPAPSPRPLNGVAIVVHGASVVASANAARSLPQRGRSR